MLLMKEKGIKLFAANGNNKHWFLTDLKALIMKAKDFIVENYPATAKDFENKECAGLHDIAYICEEYHKSEVKNLGLFSVSQRSELLSNFASYLNETYNLNIEIDDQDVETFNKIAL